MKLADPIDQSDWLNQHITHRIRAAVAGTPYLEQLLQNASGTTEEKRQKAEFCRDMAMWEGRHAAVRWLIEFVGVVADQSGKPIPSKRRKKKGDFIHDVDISDLPGGNYFDLQDPKAAMLAEVWLGCSKATAHATFGSNHPSIARDRLVEATRIVAAHMEKTIYAKAGKSVVI